MHHQEDEEKMWLEGRKTVHCTLEFFGIILEDIGPANPNNWYWFTIDNLNTHCNIAVVERIHAYGRDVVYCALYYPLNGAMSLISTEFKL